jgi:hypothetical protein
VIEGEDDPTINNPRSFEGNYEKIDGDDICAEVHGVIVGESRVLKRFFGKNHP